MESQACETHRTGGVPRSPGLTIKFFRSQSLTNLSADLTRHVCNGVSQLLCSCLQVAYTMLEGMSDSYQDPLVNSLQTACVENATLIGPAARRRALLQVR